MTKQKIEEKLTDEQLIAELSDFASYGVNEDTDRDVLDYAARRIKELVEENKNDKRKN